MKSSLALLVFCVVLALVSNTEAGKGKDGKEKGKGWGKMMKGKCKGMMNFKHDPEWKNCAPKKDGADGDEDGDMDNEGGDGGGGEGGKKKGRGKGMMKCWMKAKKIIDGNKFQLEAAKNAITSKMTDQPETAAAITKLSEECAKEKKLADLDFSDGNKDCWKALVVCIHKSMKPCMKEKKEQQYKHPGLPSSTENLLFKKQTLPIQITIIMNNKSTI